MTILRKCFFQEDLSVCLTAGRCSKDVWPCPTLKDVWPCPTIAVLLFAHRYFLSTEEAAEQRHLYRSVWLNSTRDFCPRVTFFFNVCTACRRSACFHGDASAADWRRGVRSSTQTSALTLSTPSCTAEVRGQFAASCKIFEINAKNFARNTKIIVFFL